MKLGHAIISLGHVAHEAWTCISIILGHVAHEARACISVTSGHVAHEAQVYNLITSNIEAHEIGDWSKHVTWSMGDKENEAYVVVHLSRRYNAVDV